MRLETEFKDVLPLYTKEVKVETVSHPKTFSLLFISVLTTIFRRSRSSTSPAARSSSVCPARGVCLPQKTQPQRPLSSESVSASPLPTRRVLSDRPSTYWRCAPS